MTMLASLPMYDWPEVNRATSAFWKHIRDALREVDFEAPDQLNGSEDNRETWRSSHLLFSQTCGYPFITALSDAVHLLWRPDYAIEGCRNGNYRSAFVVPRGQASDLKSFQSKRLAFNSQDSLSGYRCLSHKVGLVTQFFGEMVESGSHRRSARMVAQGEADCAAIDAVCWDMLQRYEPAVADALEVSEWLPEFPALPFITSIHQSENAKQAIKDAVLAGFSASKNDNACDGLKIRGLIEAQHDDYVPLLTLS